MGGNIVTKTLTGIVHGNTIELLTAAGLPDGTLVEIQIKIISNSDGEKSLLDDWSEEDDLILEEIERDRRRGYSDPKDY